MPLPAPVMTATAPSNVPIASFSFPNLRPEALLVLSSPAWRWKTNATLEGTWRVLEGDEARTTLKGRVVHSPLKHDHQAIPIANQEHEMHDQPHEPSQQTCEAQLPNCGDSIEASDRGQIPFIDVMKGLRVRFSRHPISNDGSRIASLLQRYLRHSWERLPILGTARRITNDKHVGVARDGQVAQDLDAACPVRLGTQPLTSRRGR